MEWKNVTVAQFQDIYQLSLKADIDEFEKLSRIVCIMYNKTEAEVDEMKLTDFNKLVKECRFILDEKTDTIPGKPVRQFTVNGNRYAINYDVSKLKHRQYTEIVHFSEKPIENMHFILASLVNPVKWFMKQPNWVEDHQRVATDMLSAPFPIIYHACVFFCKVLTGSIKGIQGCLEKEMMAKGMTKSQATDLIKTSLGAMGGCFPQSK